MKAAWRAGNRLELLENGDGFFPRVCAEIAAARHEVLLETFILFEDRVGRMLHAAASAAARRGVRVELTVDGYGSQGLSDVFLAGLLEAGVRVRIFGPGPTWFGLRTNVFRRLHRKLVVIDGRIGYVGGINFGADHLESYGAQAKQDYAVRIEGPVVADIHTLLHNGTLPPRRWYQRRRPAQAALQAELPRVGEADVMFVTRDNRHHRSAIERQYRLGIRTARRELIIANAYFFPGYLLLRDLRNAARRGVDVRLIVQGAPDVPLATAAARWLYRYLAAGGVRIYEYCRRPLHGKVAVADHEWATVGSSNLDPLSLYVNLEANVMIRDRRLASELRASLCALIEHHCTEVDASTLPKPNWLSTLWATVVFHALRRFPRWAGMLPAHTPRVAAVRASALDDAGALARPPAPAPPVPETVVDVSDRQRPAA